MGRQPLSDAAGGVIRLALTYLASGLAFAAVDAVWLTQVGPRLYRPALDPVLADQVRPGPALAFYLIYIAGVLGLAVLPAARSGAGYRRAAGTGALLGLVAYSTYDLTNYATLKVWSPAIALADIAWGTALTAVAAVAGLAAHRALSRA